MTIAPPPQETEILTYEQYVQEFMNERPTSIERRKVRTGESHNAKAFSFSFLPEQEFGQGTPNKEDTFPTNDLPRNSMQKD